ncbi:MAG: peptidylprolyl isomerase [Cyanobacteria bacterium]|nr:peptidylprolyl isomerase [Cyanobacteriota bacterium]
MSDASLPFAINQLGTDLPLPDPQLLTNLAATELLDAYLQRRLLEALVAIHGAAVEASGDKDTEPELGSEEVLMAYGRRRGLADLEALDAWRRSLGLDLDQLERLVQFDADLAATTEELWNSQVTSLFIQERLSYDQVVMSMVRLDDPDLATELFFQLQEGELSFPSLVENYSKGNDRTNRGVIGPIRLKQLNPLLAKVVRRYAPGELIPPHDINGTVHLMRVESLESAQLDEPLRQQLLGQLRSQWLMRQLATLHRRLQDDPATT